MQFIDGLRGKFNDRPRDAVPQKTIVVMAECAGTDLPGKDDVVYFEIPEAIGRITSLQAEVHLFVFEKLPATPTQGLNEIDRAKRSCWCWTIGLEDDRGGVELRADWEIGNRARPVLHRTRSPFRPSPRRGMQQVRVEVRNEVYDAFEYLFGSARATWLPSLDDEEQVRAVESERELLQSLELIPREDQEWYRVNDLVLVPEDEGTNEGYRKALTDMSPESGNYILISLHRRKREAVADED